MNKYDPNEVFINSFGRRMKKTGTKLDLDRKLTHCALMDNCICATAEDCAPRQDCSTVDGYKYKVCKTKNQLPTNFFPKIILPNATENIFDFLAHEASTLSTALLSKCTVKSLFATLGNTASNTFGAFIKAVIGDIQQAGTSAIQSGISGIKNILPFP